MTTTAEKPKTEAKAKKPLLTYGVLDDEEDLVNILYYGEPGTGKTTAMASLARLGKVVYIEAESGLKSRALKRFDPKFPTKNIELVQDSVQQSVINFGKLKALCDQLRIDLAEDPNAVAGVIFDSVTEIQKKILRQVMDKRIQRFNERGMEVEAHKNVVEDYGICTEIMRDLIRMYRDLPCHVGFAGLEVRDEDDDGAITYRPNLTPKLAADLTGYVDLVCYTTDRVTGGTRYFLGSFRRGGKYQAKDRFGVMPELLVNPSYDRVVQYINGELTEETDKQQQAWLKAKAEKTKASAS